MPPQPAQLALASVLPSPICDGLSRYIRRGEYMKSISCGDLIPRRDSVTLARVCHVRPRIPIHHSGQRFFSKDHPACHQQGPYVALIGSFSLDQSFGPMVCSPLALAQQPASSTRNVNPGAWRKCRDTARVRVVSLKDAFHGKLPQDAIPCWTQSTNVVNLLGANLVQLRSWIVVLPVQICLSDIKSARSV
ncbi:hypothetical protein M419DRAFT_37848 [Trichoderma reesei RUT C-30]|uniref:Uncharacterized protein n=1 Tax=Hypocrea jecorina (strain ATCC 56765 / BCRC 32924 / NRRL 11460 / Rut C-30) TaxID=1344414 RepID=A0A024S2X5_HYPJR|nr:hypothetical protein M419DRAFT_37848 [Trichoderma reesei RUT C-30]